MEGAGYDRVTASFRLFSRALRDGARLGGLVREGLAERPGDGLVDRELPSGAASGTESDHCVDSTVVNLLFERLERDTCRLGGGLSSS
jgi:hypothetical protein